MKPIKLKMQAFGPYVKPVELDFENGLHGEKFFLIHGATGAGKTSILDAICYALYNESAGGERKKNDLCSEFVPFENVTELEFTFSLGKEIFKIHRSFKRKPDKNDETKFKVDSTAELFVDNQFKYGKVTEVNEFLKDNLGFNVEQFRKVVILPQGKFRDFLAASSNEKMGILNLIFDSVLYEKIERGLKEKSEGAKKILDNLNNRRENFLNTVQEIGNISQPADEKILSELIKNFSEELKKSVANRENLKIQFDKASTELTQGKILVENFAMFENAEKNFHEETKKLSAIIKNFNVAKKEFDKRKGEEPRRNDLEIKIEALKKNQADLIELQTKKSELEKAKVKEKSAQEKISELETVLEKCKILLEERKNQREKFRGADLKFQIAQQNLEKAQDKQARLAEIERLKKELLKAKKNLARAEKNFDDAQIELNRLKLLQKMCTAAFLATNLKDGEPCPVCGSTSHPKLAITDEIIPTDEQIEQRETILQRREKEKTSALRAVDTIGEKINLHSEEIKKFEDVLNLDEAQKIFESAKNDAEKFADFEKRVNDGEKYISDREKELKTAQKNLTAASTNAANLSGIVETLQNQISEEYRENPKKILDDLNKKLHEKKILDEAWQKAQDNFHKLDREKSNQEGKIKSAEKSKNDAAKKIDGKIKPDIKNLEKIADDSKNFYTKAVEKVTLLQKDLTRLEEISEKISELGEKIQIATADFEIWEKLSAVANGKNFAKMTFQTYYLNAMFQNVIFEANERLDKMSDGRYKFVEGKKKQAQKSGLDLNIFDENTGRARPVETLSGGESFLASLSLALGLAAVVKNSAGGINLDTIFIDEGFGSLDAETLDFAINALTDLQNESGRLVGIISHVEELKQRIPARLEVTKTKHGSTAKFI